MSANGVVFPTSDYLTQRSERLYEEYQRIRNQAQDTKRQERSAQQENPIAQQAAQTAQNAGAVNAQNGVQSVNGQNAAAENGQVEGVRRPTTDSFERANPFKALSQVDRETVDRMQAETAERMQRLVSETLSRQITRGDNKDLWNALRTGRFTVDEQTRAEAEKETGEDGYWGVEQTSERIVKMATALTGGDPAKLDSMREAFEKGYKQAEKAWGSELPSLSQRTREAVLQKFEALKQRENDPANNPQNNPTISATRNPPTINQVLAAAN